MKTEQVKKGVFYLLVTSFLFSTQQALGKVLYYLSTFERTFYFSLVAAIITSLYRLFSSTGTTAITSLCIAPISR